MNRCVPNSTVSIAKNVYVTSCVPFKKFWPFLREHASESVERDDGVSTAARVVRTPRVTMTGPREDSDCWRVQVVLDFTSRRTARACGFSRDRLRKFVVRTKKNLFFFFSPVSIYHRSGPWRFVAAVYSTGKNSETLSRRIIVVARYIINSYYVTARNCIRYGRPKNVKLKCFEPRTPYRKNSMDG